jgi:hypothetical protein
VPSTTYRRFLLLHVRHRRESAYGQQEANATLREFNRYMTCNVYLPTGRPTSPPAQDGSVACERLVMCQTACQTAAAHLFGSAAQSVCQMHTPFIRQYIAAAGTAQCGYTSVART